MLNHFPWTDLSPDESRELAARYLFNGDANPLEEVTVTGQVAELPYYDELRLLWLRFDIPGRDEDEHFFALDGETDGWTLDGTSRVVHYVNKRFQIEIGAEAAEDYLRFFCFAVQGDQGPFQLFEYEADADEFTEEEMRIARMARPVESLGPNETGEFCFAARVRYDRDLFDTKFKVAADGMVLMYEDEQIEGGVPLTPFPFAPTLRNAQAVAAAVSRGVAKVGPSPQTRRIMVESLLERALGHGAGGTLIEQFNARHPSKEPLENFCHMLVAASPVVAIESSMPFVEETVSEIVSGVLGAAATPTLFKAMPADHDPGRLAIRVPPAGPAIGLIPLHAYNSVGDVDRVAYEISSRNLACLIGCTRLADVPESLAEVVDITLTLPRLDEATFAQVFSRTLGIEMDGEWDADGARWLSHVHHSDFQQPATMGLGAEEALAFIRERADARMRDVEPAEGLGLSNLHGLGEARSFAEDLISDIHAALEGELDWMHVDRGALLVGAPGTGKTTLARAIAKECGIRFIDASAAGWQAHGHLGDHIRAIRSDFARARRFAPAILFIDEIDSIGNRAEFSGSNSQYMIEVVNAVLEQIQGMDPEAPVIVLAATNFEEKVDAALRRAGRLDRVIRIPRPNARALADIYEHYFAEYLDPDDAETLDAEQMGRLSLGATGADVELYVRGALRRARREQRNVTETDLIHEITGKPRDHEHAPRLTPDEAERVAVHEAGHALASCLQKSAGRHIGFVSIVPRSDGTLGFVAQLPPERMVYTRNEYLERIEISLAGRAAEELVYGADDVTSGAGGVAESSDLAVATRIAQAMITRYGLGPDRSLLWANEPDEEQIEEAEDLLQSCYERIKEKLSGRRDALDRLTEALVDRQELTGDEVREIVG